MDDAEVRGIDARASRDAKDMWLEAGRCGGKRMGAHVAQMPAGLGDWIPTGNQNDRPSVFLHSYR